MTIMSSPAGFGNQARRAAGENTSTRRATFFWTKRRRRLRRIGAQPEMKPERAVNRENLMSRSEPRTREYQQSWEHQTFVLF